MSTNAILKGGFERTAFAKIFADVCRLGPRFVGTDGERAAREFIEREFIAAGLDAVRVEPVTVLAYRPEAAACMLIPSGQSLACSGLQFTASGTVEAEAVWVDCVDVETGALIDQSLDLTGRIAIVTTPYPYVIAPALIERGVAGILVVGDAPDGLVSHYSAQLYPPSPPPHFPAIPLPVPGVTLEASAGAALIDRVRAASEIVRIEHAASYAQTVTGNVLGEIRGSTAQQVVVGAHYDTQWGTVGACDNASGIATLISFARSFARRQPRRTLVLAAFADEEHGCYGSTAFCEQHIASLANTVAMINLDALGWSRVAKRALWADASIHDYCRSAARRAGWKADIEQEASQFSGSDYNPFIDAGVPAAFLWRYPPGNPYYHSEGDSLALVDVDVILETARVAAYVALELAEDEQLDLGRARPRRQWRTFA